MATISVSLLFCNLFILYFWQTFSALSSFSWTSHNKKTFHYNLALLSIFCVKTQGWISFVHYAQQWLFWLELNLETRGSRLKSFENSSNFIERKVSFCSKNELESTQRTWWLVSIWLWPADGRQLQLGHATRPSRTTSWFWRSYEATILGGLRWSGKTLFHIALKNPKILFLISAIHGLW